MKLPVRVDSGPEKGKLDWRRPSFTTVRNMLTHPMYAGAYVYGRTCQNPTTRQVRGVTQRLSRDQWHVLLKDRYPPYISWDDFERNVAQLEENRSLAARRGSVRRGRALLPGLVVCRRCGFRMTTRYRGKASQPRYLCDSGRLFYGHARCQGVAARVIDEEVARLALVALEPASLEVSLKVAADVEGQRAQLESHHRKRVERATYEAERARRQFDAVEPENRLVARTLEQQWEEKLRAAQQIEGDYQRFQREQPQPLGHEEHEQIRRLANDLPELWQAETTTDEDRKVILRQIIDRVVVDVEGNSEWVELRVDWIGGQQTYSRIRRPVAGTSQLSRWPQLAGRLRELKDEGLSSRQIATRLQKEGFRPAKGKTVTAEIVRIWLSRYGLTSRRRKPSLELAADEWTIPDIMDRYHLPYSTVYGRIRRHQLKARQRAGRWIVQATLPELEHLAANCDQPSRATEGASNRNRKQRSEAVTRGAL